ncbi:hypothetical protein SOVF_182810 isoform B [Spinacia oleracea]|uniref:Pre-rRNA-processing protein RIX1 N-terminal domain-containing protein n=1 Tax=Spinacia oleracea TaxID=3562 RepID=A0ABM3RDF6_SPIOL|nr:uncharacterized protein LOC110785420 [Spinacia oleracea]KNA06259.1 hypothetical protein SOVF_182810 isoform B [Spinacia oleracea]
MNMVNPLSVAFSSVLVVFFPFLFECLKLFFTETVLHHRVSPVKGIFELISTAAVSLKATDSCRPRLTKPFKLISDLLKLCENQSNKLKSVVTSLVQGIGWLTPLIQFLRPPCLLLQVLGLHVAKKRVYH